MAATGGYLRILKWARDNGCQWDHQTCAYYAALGEHVGILKWARNNGCPSNSFTLESAAYWAS